MSKLNNSSKTIISSQEKYNYIERKSDQWIPQDSAGKGVYIIVNKQKQKPENIDLAQIKM